MEVQWNLWQIIYWLPLRGLDLVAQGYNDDGESFVEIYFDRESRETFLYAKKYKEWYLWLPHPMPFG